MKNFNSSAFLKACSGIALVIFACAALFFSVKPAQASPQNFPGMLNKPMSAGSGKYQFIYNVGYDSNNNFYWQMIIGNSETGGYKAYRWSVDDQKWMKMFDECVAFPELP